MSTHTQETTAGPIGVAITDDLLHAVSFDRSKGVVANSVRAVIDKNDPLGSLIETVGGLREKFGEIERIGVAVPGLIDRATGIVAYSERLPKLSKVNLRELLREKAQVEAVIENDANAAAFGEYSFGAGRGCSNLFYATIGKGVGGSLILNGEIWRGTNGFAGEFGFMTINSEGTRLEDMASSSNIVRRTLNRFNQDNTSSLANLSEDEIDIRAIIKAAESGDDLARLMLERTGAFVGTALASVINLLNVERIVVGGEMTEAGDMVLEPMIEKARKFSFEPSFQQAKIVAAELTDASAIGAALIAQQG